MKLGRLPADPAALARAPQLAGHMRAMPPPPTLDRSHIAFVPGLDRNDELSDCTWVGIANAARGMALLNGFGVDIPTDRVVAAYSASTGYDPANPASDQGAVELDVLGYQLAHGFDTGGQVPLVADFATFDPADRATFASTLARVGPVYLGVDLAAADLDTSQTWDTATPGDQTPGSWGGHALVAWDYTGLGDTDVVRLATWGMLLPCTWRWLQSRVEEAHVLIWRQLMKSTRLNFAGIDYDGLRATNMAWSA
jgi:hypothetical protein